MQNWRRLASNTLGSPKNNVGSGKQDGTSSLLAELCPGVKPERQTFKRWHMQSQAPEISTAPPSGSQMWANDSQLVDYECHAETQLHRGYTVGIMSALRSECGVEHVL